MSANIKSVNLSSDFDSHIPSLGQFQILSIVFIVLVSYKDFKLELDNANVFCQV